MSEKPQATREEQEDLLEQIFTQGLEKINASTQKGTGSEAPPEDSTAAPKEEGAGKGSPPADRKSRRSAAYLYLLVLFGAAFLLLLLAYFIQQRSSENTISDLQESMDLSRQELLDEIQALKKRNAALSDALSEMQGLYESQRAEISRQSDTYTAFVVDYYATLAELNAKLYSWESFWTLEQFYLAGNYESCAAVLLMQEMGQYRYRAPDAERQEEIVRAVIDAGILDEDYDTHTWNYNDLLDAYQRDVLAGLAESGRFTLEPEYDNADNLNDLLEQLSRLGPAKKPAEGGSEE